MGLSVANILLEVTGDSSEARRELEDVARDLALFAREEAEAEAYVDTTEAKAELDELKALLKKFSADEISAEVNLKIAKAQADLAVLQAELDKVDGEDVTVDVDVKRGIVERIGSLSEQITDLGDDAGDASRGGLRNLVSGLTDAWSEADVFGTSLGTIAKAGPVLVAVLVSIAGQLLAIFASAGSAALGIGALAIAFVSTLLPGIALAVGAVANFKEKSDEAGTAAHDLAESFSTTWEAFKEATAGGSEALFEGLSEGIKGISPLLETLAPAFTELGKAGGEALKTLGEKFTSPAWTKFFEFLTESLTELAPLFTRSFGAFADILKNIATAAMPFLIEGFRDLAKWLEGVADKTSDMDGLGKAIGGMVDSLKAWGELLGGAVDLASAFIEAFAPFGDEIVTSLGEGAHALAEWLQSSEGAEKIQQFFEATGPLASEVATLLLGVGLALVQLGEFVAPALTPIAKGFNDIFDVINKVLSWLNDNVSVAFREALGTVVSFVGGLGKVGKAGEELQAALRLLVTAAGLAGGALGDVGDAVVTAFGDAVDFTKDAVEKIAGFVSTPIDFVLSLPGDIASAARSLWNDVKGVISDGIKFVLSFASDVGSRARNIWNDVKGKITDGIKFVLSFADDLARRARAIWGDVKGIVTDGINFLLSLPSDLAARARNIWNDVKGVISDGISFALSLPGGLVEAAKNLWEKVKDAVSGGIDLIVHLVPDIGSLPGKVASTLGFANGVEDLLRDSLAMVGERGPELAFLPQGTDIYTAGETRNILKALGKGASVPAATGGAGAASGGGGGNTFNYDLKVISPGTGSPDPDIALAKWGAGLRAKGALG